MSGPYVEFKMSARQLREASEVFENAAERAEVEEAARDEQQRITADGGRGKSTDERVTVDHSR
jgi:hypothetical protein